MSPAMRSLPKSIRTWPQWAIHLTCVHQNLITRALHILLGTIVIIACVNVKLEAAEVNQAYIARPKPDLVNIDLVDAVRREVSVQEDIRFRQLRWFLILAGLIGLGTFGTLANYLIEKAVENRFEKKTEKISRALDFSKFYTIALKVDMGDSFSQPDLDAIKSFLRKVEKDSEVRHWPEFLAALLQVAKSFASAGQSASIDELFSMYEREILSAPSLVEPLLRHYGQEIVATPVRQANDPGLMAFRKLERVASSSNFPELALACRTLYESSKSHHDPQIVSSLITRSAKLSAKDKQLYLIELLLRSKEDNWVKTSRPETFVIQVAVRRLFGDFKADFSAMHGLSEELCRKISDNGIDAEEAVRISEAL